MNQSINKSTPDLIEKLAAARSYGYAQQALMQAIVDERPAHVVTHGLDVVRIAGSVFAGTNPAATRFEADLTPKIIEDTAEFLNLYTVIKQTEKLIGDWLQSAVRSDVPEVIQYVDRALGVAADPRHDIFLVAGDESELVGQVLRDRGYVRVLEWAGLCQSSDSSQLDIGRTDAALASIRDLEVCRPGRVWLLWGPGAECPEATKAVLDERLRTVFMNRNTTGSLGERWARQFIGNIPALAKRGRDLAALRNAMQGCGAVIVGAGPSLDSAMSWLRAQAVRPVVIASYKAVRSLVRGGVTPDFIVMLDPKQGSHHLAGLDLRGVAAILTEVTVDPDALAMSDVPLLPYSSGPDTLKLAETLGDFSVPMIRSGGSVIHIALQFARLLGSTRITLAGVDFGFPDDRLYASGAGEGDVLSLAADRRSYVRRAIDGNSRSGLLIGALANDGSVLTTTIELDHYRNWTEQFIRDCRRHESSVEFFNLSRSGAQIDGATAVSEIFAHVASSVETDPMAAITALRPLFAAKGATQSLAPHLRDKAKKLRALSRACAKAVAATRSGKASDLKHFGQVAEQAVACPEVSLIMTRRLQVIDEQARRSVVDVPERLCELAEVAGEEAHRVAALYSSVARRLSGRASVQNR